MSRQRVVETTFRVRYAETDAMGVVYHANYLVWFEVGRGDYFRALGQDYGRVGAAGLLPARVGSLRPLPRARRATATWSPCAPGSKRSAAGA